MLNFVTFQGMYRRKRLKITFAPVGKTGQKWKAYVQANNGRISLVKPVGPPCIEVAEHLADCYIREFCTKPLPTTGEG